MRSSEQILSSIYDAFSVYKLDLSKDVRCFDYGPTEEELEAVTRPLREIPDRFVAAMEWFGEGWGTTTDVK